MNFFWNLLTQNNTVFAKILTGLFFIVGLPAILHHAMWRDELNVWLIVRESQSLLELFHHIHYEGHPFVWYVCLAILRQFTTNPVIMQVFHLCLATLSVYVFTRYSPFSYFQKLLFCLGYIPFYEYLLISRNYAIGLLLVFIFCSLYSSRQQSYLKLAVVLFFMANVNAYCLLLAIAFSLTLVIEYICRQFLHLNLVAKKHDIVVSSLIISLGIIISFLQLIPPQDSNLAGGLSGFVLNFDFNHLTKTLVRLWNSYIIVVLANESEQFSLILLSVLSIIFFLVFSISFIVRPIILFLYIVGTMEILVFTYVKFLGSPRHYGHLYILLIVCIWLSSYYHSLFSLSSVTVLPKTVVQAAKLKKSYYNIAIMVILYCQMVGGVFAFSRDIIIPFSSSKEASAYIKDQYQDKLNDLFIVGSRDYAISPISAYINHQIYYPEISKMGSFVLFTTKRKEINHIEVLSQVNQICQKELNPLLLILNRPLELNHAKLKIDLIEKFTKGFIYDERYYLYSVTKRTVE